MAKISKNNIQTLTQSMLSEFTKTHKLPPHTYSFPTTGDAVYVEYVVALLQQVVHTSFSKDEVQKGLEYLYDMIQNVNTRTQCFQQVALCLATDRATASFENKISPDELIFIAIVRALAKKEGSFDTMGKVPFDIFLNMATDKYFKKIPLSKYEFAFFKLRGMIRDIQRMDTSLL